MTYSRPTCLALIARVESGLTFGQLQPYADALREAMGEVDAARAKLIEVLREDTIRAVSDERTLSDLVEMASGDLRQFRAMIDLLRRQLKSTDDAYRAARDKAGAPSTGSWVCPTCKDPECG